MQNQQQSTGPANTDYLIAACIVLEAFIFYCCLVYKISLLGVLLPIAVSIASVTIATLSVRDFFRTHQ